MNAPIEPSPDSRLAQLRERYHQLKPDVDEKKSELDNVTKGIKAELNALRGEDQTEIVLTSPGGDFPALKMRAETRENLDTKKLKSELEKDPAVYAQYTYQSTVWKLERA